jgi:hypothetical protein
MTLAVAVKGPEGLVLAVDSRLTLRMPPPGGGEPVVSYFDNATKMTRIEGQPHVGVVTYGLGAIGTGQPRSVLGFVSEFETGLTAEGGDRLKVVDIARKLGEFYAEQWQKAATPADSQPISFLVAGFDQGEAYGRIYGVAVPSALEPEAYCADYFGARWNGQYELVNRLMTGFDPLASTIVKNRLKLQDKHIAGLEKEWAQKLDLPIPYQFFALQDCVDFATFLVTMTSAVQAWTVVGNHGVGGAVDVATITRTRGFEVIKQKQINVRAWQ